MGQSLQLLIQLVGTVFLMRSMQSASVAPLKKGLHSEEVRVEKRGEEGLVDEDLWEGGRAGAMISRVP